MKYFALLTILLISLRMNSQNNDFPKLKGNWTYTDGYNTAILRFVDDSKLIYNGVQSPYTLISTPRAVRVFDEMGYYFDYVYRLDGNKLILTFPDNKNYEFEKADNKAKTSQKTVPSAGNTALYGSFCHWSGSSSSYSGSSYSHTDRVTFDGKGRFAYGTETSFSSDAGLYGDSGGNDSGGSYSVKGNNIYLTFDDGTKYTLEVYVRQNSGEITEIRYGQKVYAKQLCE